MISTNDHQYTLYLTCNWQFGPVQRWFFVRVEVSIALRFTYLRKLIQYHRVPPPKKKGSEFITFCNNGVARTLKNVQTSNGDYCIKK